MGLNGALAGLVAITAGCNVIGPMESLLVGAIGGVLVVEGVFLLDRLRIDDPVGAIPVHGVSGVFGTLAVGLFAADDGLFHGGGLTLLGIQALGTVAAGGFAFAVGGATWLVLARLPGGIRVPRDHELEGLDIAECGVEAYGDEPRGMHADPSSGYEEQALPTATRAPARG